MDETNGMECTVLAPDGVTEQPAVMPPANPQTLEQKRTELWARKDEIQAQIHEVDAKLDEAFGDADGAAWHRAEAKAYRSNTPEDKAAGDRAWLFMMARRYLKDGRTPAEDSHRRSDVLAEMERLKAAKG